MKRKNAKPIIISMALAVAIAITALVPASGEAEGSDAKRRPPVYQIAASDYITPFYGSPIFVKALNVEAREFGGFVGYETLYARVTGPGGVKLLSAVRYIGNMLQVAGIKCLLKSNRADAQKGVIISESVWDEEYGRSPEVLDQNIIVANTSYPIAGVAKSSGGLFDDTEIWIPLGKDVHCDDSICFRILARLKAGVEMEQGQVQISRVLGAFDEEYRFLNGTNLKISPLDNVLRPKYVVEEAVAAVARKGLVHKS